METNVLRLLGVGGYLKKKVKKHCTRRCPEYYGCPTRALPPISSGPTLSQLSITHDEVQQFIKA